jgi:hypothetical protein
VKDAAAFDANQLPSQALLCVSLACFEGIAEGSLSVGAQLFDVVPGAVLAVRQQFEVGQAVIGLVAVDMMHVVTDGDLPALCFPNFSVQTDNGDVVAVSIPMPGFPAPLHASITHAEPTLIWAIGT